MRKNCFLLLLATLLLFPLSAQAKGFSTIYVLGDSLSDQGNLFQATLSVIRLYGVPAVDHYYQGRFSNGENYVDYLSEKLDLVIDASFSGGGSNFAYGGARTNYNIAEQSFPVGMFPWSLNAEITEFRNRQVTDPKALYVVFAGSNDLKDILLQYAADGNATTVASRCEAVVLGIKSAIDAFAEAGARDILVPLIPDLGVVPGIKLEYPQFATQATQLTKQLNAEIVKMLVSYSAGNANINIMTFDTFSIIRQVVAKPKAYHFKNVSAPCYNGFVDPFPAGVECENPDDYFFWDVEHPTTAAHQLLADSMMQTIVAGTMADFVDELAQLDNLPKKTEKLLIKSLNAVKKILTDKSQKNDRAAIASLRLLAEALELMGDSPFFDVDTEDLVVRARQIADLAEANLP